MATLIRKAGQAGGPAPENPDAPKLIRRAQAAPEPIGSIFDPIRDAGRALVPAVQRLGAEISKGERGDPAALLGVPVAAVQAITNQVTGPVSRAAAKAGVPIYDEGPSIFSAEFWDDKADRPRALQGAERARALEGVLNTALAGARVGRPGFAKGGVLTREVTAATPPPAPAARITAPQRRTARALEQAMARDRAGGFAGDAAPGAMPLHAQGENFQAVAEAIAKSPGPGRQLIRQRIRDYSANAPSRTKADIANDLGGRGDYFQTLDDLVATRKAEADKGIKAIEGAEVKLDDGSVQALRSDLAKSAIRERAKNALASPNADVRDAGARLNRLADDVLDKPGDVTLTLRDAQEISRTLQQQASTAFRAGDGDRGRALADLGKAIRSNAADPKRGGVKGYGAWLKKYGDDIGSEEALQLGRDVFAKGNDAEVLQKRVGDMSETQRALFQKGVGEAMLNEVRTKGDVAHLRSLLKNEETRDRIALAFPDDQSFARFVETAGRRVNEQDISNKVMGGSPTEPLRAARADLEDEGADVLGVVSDIVTGDVRGLSRKGAKAAIKALPRRSRSVIKDPEANLAAARAVTDEASLTDLLNLLQAERARQARLRAIVGQVSRPLLVEGAAVPSDERGVR